MAATTIQAAEGRRALTIRAMVGRYLGWVVVAGFGAWFLWNFIDSPAQFVQVSIIGLTNGSIYALIALGYTLVYGIIELINFAHGDLFMLGSVFGMHLLNQWLGVTDSSFSAWLVLVAVMVATMAFCGTINVTVERVAYRPLRHAPKLAPLITAIGMSFILQNIGLLWNGEGQVGIRRVLPGGNAFEIAGVHVSWLSVIVVCVTIPLLLLLSYVVRNTRQGKAMRAVAQDTEASRMMGIDVNRTISITFAVAGALAGAAGVLYVTYYTQTRFDLGFQLGLFAFTAAVLGGIGNLTGAALGALCIGLITAYNDGLSWHAPGSDWTQSIVFTILILILVFRPEGLLGEPEADRA